MARLLKTRSQTVDNQYNDPEKKVKRLEEKRDVGSQALILNIRAPIPAGSTLCLTNGVKNGSYNNHGSGEHPCLTI